MDHVIRLSEINEPIGFPFEYHELASEDHFWFQWRFTVIMLQLKHTLLPENSRILDLGCGNGTVRRQIEQSTSWSTDGMDIDFKALQLNRGLKGNTYLYNISDTRIEFQNYYDVVFLLDVLEHIQDKKPFLDSVLYLLKPGGVLIINVPAFECFRSYYDEMNGHFYRYTKKTLKKDLQDHHLNIDFIGYWGGMLVPLLVLRKLMYYFYKPLKVSKSGFQPPNSLFNTLFKKLMRIETSIFKRVSIGTSLLAIISKME